MQSGWPHKFLEILDELESTLYTTFYMNQFYMPVSSPFLKHESALSVETGCFGAQAEMIEFA